MPSEFEEYLKFKEFQKSNKKKSKKKKKNRRANAQSSIFKGVTKPEIYDALDYYTEARKLEKDEALQGLRGAEKRAMSRAFDRETMVNVSEIKAGKNYRRFMPKKKNTSSLWDIPDNRAFYPEDWENLKAGSKFAGKTAIKGASAFGRGAKNLGESAFGTGKDIFSFARENKNYFSPEKKLERQRAKTSKEFAKWEARKEKMTADANRRKEAERWKKSKLNLEALSENEKANLKREIQEQKTQFMQEKDEVKKQLDRDKKKADYEFKREQFKTRRAKKEFDQNNPRKWYKGFRR